MSQLYVDNIKNRTGGAVNAPSGIVVSGVGTFSGNVSIAGTLTYEDVTNIDSVGIITAQSGINVSGGNIVVASGTYEGDASNIVSGKWTLGANGTNHYTFTGIGFTVTTDDPEITLQRGTVYQFVNNMGAHPFRIQSTVNGSAGTEYNNGVTNNNVSNGTLTFKVPFDAPSTLYYQCTAHPNMGGKINIAGGGSDSYVGIVSATTGSNLSGYKVEDGLVGSSLGGGFYFDLANGHTQIYVGGTSGTYQPNFRVSGSQSFASLTSEGSVMTCTLIVYCTNSSHYLNTSSVQIDSDSGSTLTIRNIGGTAISSGNSGTYDVYTFTIIRTNAPPSTPSYQVFVQATNT